MLESLATLIVLGCIVFAVIGIAIFVIRVVIVIVAAIAAAVVAGWFVLVAFQVLRFFAENPQYIG